MKTEKRKYPPLSNKPGLVFSVTSIFACKSEKDLFVTKMKNLFKDQWLSTLYTQDAKKKTLFLPQSHNTFITHGKNKHKINVISIFLKYEKKFKALINDQTCLVIDGFIESC